MNPTQHRCDLTRIDGRRIDRIAAAIWLISTSGLLAIIGWAVAASSLNA